MAPAATAGRYGAPSSSARHGPRRSADPRCRGTADVLLHAARRRARRRQRLVPGRQGRDTGDRRRVRLRQEHHGALPHETDPRSARAHHGWPHHARWRRPRPAQSRRHAQNPRQRHLDDLPGADDVAEPRHDDRQPDRRGLDPASGHDQATVAAARDRDARYRAHPRTGAAREGISRISCRAACGSAR